MKELEEYQEMRTRERNRKLGLDRKRLVSLTDSKSFLGRLMRGFVG